MCEELGKNLIIIIGIDIGEWMIVRYDENRKEVIGLTIVGMRSKLLEHIR